MNVFDLMAKLTLDKSEYEKGLDGATQDATTFGSKLKTGLGTAAKLGEVSMAALGAGTVALTKNFISGAGEVAEYGDEIDKMSQKIGISAQAYQEWDFIAQHSGTSMASLKVSFKTLSNAAQSGADEFKKLGISLKDAASMSTEDLFSAVITGLQNMEEGTERTAIASKLLGRGATELGALLNMSAEDTKEMKEQLHELGGVMSDDAVKSSAAYQDSLQNLQVSMSGIKNKIMSQFLPSMTKVSDGLAKIFSGDGSAVELVNEGIDELITGIADKIPDIIEVGGKIVGGLVESISTNLPKVVEGASGIVMTLVQNLVAGLPQMAQTGAQLIFELAKGLGDSLPTLIPTAIDAVITIVTTMIDNIPMLIDGALQLITGFAEGLIDAIPVIIEKIPQIIESLVTGLINSAPKLLEAGVKLIGSLAMGLIQAIPKLIQALPQIVGTIINGLASLPGKMIELGSNLIRGIWEGISNVASWIWSKITGFFGGIVDGIKNFFGIKSPSRLMRDQIGKYMAQGVGVGFVDEMDDVKKDITNSMDDISAPDIGLGSISYGVTGIPSTAPIASATTQSTEVKGLLQTMIDKLDNLGSPAQIILDTGVLVGETVTEMNKQLGVMANMNERSVLA